MLTLFFIFAVIFAIISFCKWKKTNFASEECGGLFIVSILVVAFVSAFLFPAIIAMTNDAKVHEKYTEAQEKVIILQQDIENLKDEEKDIDKFVTEYDNLKQQLEDAQNYIEQQEGEWSMLKFLLYFG